MTATARSLVTRLREAGATLTCSDAGRVQFKAPAPLPPDLLADARVHRDAIAAVLLAEAVPDGATVHRAHHAPRAPIPTGDDLDGFRRAALMRPPSWADPAARPSAGSYCSCCRGRRWWCELEAPKGWRCYTCHPADGARPGETIEVRT